MAYKTMSIRIDKDDYDFVTRLANEENEDLSATVRELIDLGRIHFAIEEYKKGTASLGKAAKIAGVSISEMMDILADYGVKNSLDDEDYRMGVKNLEAIY